MSGYPVGAVGTTARIVEQLSDGAEAGVTELADALDVSKGTVHAHLTTLEQLGVVQARDGRYRLGLKLLDTGMAARDGLPVYEVAHDAVTELADSTGESAALAVRENGQGVFADVQRVGRNRRRIRLGSRTPLHTTAPGKVLLAGTSAGATDAYLSETLAAPTERTVASADALRAELRSIGDQQLAFDRGELFSGMRGVAAPIRGESGVVGALAVQGPAERLSGKRLEEDLSGLVLSAAKEVCLSLN